MRSVKSKPQEEISLTMKALDHDMESRKAEIKLVVDTGVNRTLISEEAWLKLKPHKGKREPKLKKKK